MQDRILFRAQAAVASRVIHGIGGDAERAYPKGIGSFDIGCFLLRDEIVPVLILRWLRFCKFNSYLG